MILQLNLTKTVSFLVYRIKELFFTCIYNNINIFMVSWWLTDSYLKNEKIKIGDIEIRLLNMVH